MERLHTLSQQLHARRERHPQVSFTFRAEYDARDRRDGQRVRYTGGKLEYYVDERDLPTANEIDAPGLWLARIDLPD